MARGRGGSTHGQRRPVDLTGILSIAEKNDLVTLVNAITERMARDISNIFDSPPVAPIQSDHDHHHHHWLLLPLHHHQKQHKSTSHSLMGIKQIGSSKPFDKTHDIIEKEEKEAMTPQLRELKKEALIFFRKWQGIVLQRVRDIAVSDQPGPQLSIRGRGRGMRGMPRGRGGGGRGGGMMRSPLTLATGLMSLLLRISVFIWRYANYCLGPPRAPSNYVDRSLATQFPPIPNALWTLDMEKRRLLLHIVFLVLLSMQEYTANARHLIQSLATSLNLPPWVYREEELRLARGLARAALNLSEEDAMALKSEETKTSRRWKLGLGNNSGKLAAPLAAVGIGAAHGGLGLTQYTAAGLLGIMADNALAIGSLFGINTLKPLGKMMETFAREVTDFAFIPIHSTDASEYRDPRAIPAEHRRLCLTIAIGGYVIGDEDITKTWQSLGRYTETFITRWETAALTSLGSSLDTVIKSSSWSSAQAEIKARTSKHMLPRLVIFYTVILIALFQFSQALWTPPGPFHFSKSARFWTILGMLR